MCFDLILNTIQSWLQNKKRSLLHQIQHIEPNILIKNVTNIILPLLRRVPPTRFTKHALLNVFIYFMNITKTRRSLITHEAMLRFFLYLRVSVFNSKHEYIWHSKINWKLELLLFFSFIYFVLIFCLFLSGWSIYISLLYLSVTLYISLRVSWIERKQKREKKKLSSRKINVINS